MKFEEILKNKYKFLSEQPETDSEKNPPEQLPDEAEPENQEQTPETPAAALDSQGAQYLIDLVRKALIVDILDDREKALLVNLKIDANNAQNSLANIILPIINKYIPDNTP